jgi:hypothetical protein
MHALVTENLTSPRPNLLVSGINRKSFRPFQGYFQVHKMFVLFENMVHFQQRTVPGVGPG